MLNRWTGNGRITDDPKIKEISTKNGKTQLVNYTIATDRNFKNKDGQRDADFIRCTAWGSNAKFLSKYVHKGDLLWNDGSIRTRRVKDKRNPKYYRYFTGIHIEDVGVAGNNRHSKVKGEAPVMPSSDKSDDKDIEQKVAHKKVKIMDDNLPF